MNSPRLWIGIVLCVFGVLWLLQGLGVVGGSPMSGETLWVVVGAVLTIAGIALAGSAVRRP